MKLMICIKCWNIILLINLNAFGKHAFLAMNDSNALEEHAYTVMNKLKSTSKSSNHCDDHIKMHLYNMHSLSWIN